jgi:phage gp16-like protein
MLNNRKAKMALIHVAKRQVGLNDECYRLLLNNVCGVESAKDIVSDKQIDELMQAFKRLGFVPVGKPVPLPAVKVEQPSIGGTKEQAYKIWKLWTEKAETPTYAALQFFVRRIAHVDSPRFLNKKLAQKIIIALNEMKGRDGYDEQERQRRNN